MTPQDHNKVIGIMHLVWGGLNALLMLIFIPFIIIILGPMGSDTTAPLELRAVFAIFGVFIATLALVFGIPPMLAGYAMLKRKSWARVLGVISACLFAFSFPVGTALCVYTMWFMFGQGEHFYRNDAFGETQNRRKPLNDASTFDWEAQRTSSAGRRKEYVPPPQPPDWRS
jgi:hypothetical protein